ncbi:MAG: MFS transporter [Gammaproteobacteria bacterium]|nr:MFS transporter [Gammaproteobacteria bacterium]
MHLSDLLGKRIRTPFSFLILASVAMPIGMSVWQALLNNYAVEQVGLTGFENGIMQSIREVPGFLAFTAVFVLLVLREQTFAVIALAVFGLGIAITGLLPTVYGLYFSVVLMSIGFHYFETVRQSLSLQWLPKRVAPRLLGVLISVGALTSFITFGSVFVLVQWLDFDYKVIYAIAGSIVILMALFLAVALPRFESRVEQRKQIVLRSKYWLYYGLTFLSGARRQIFVAFAGFLLVQRFGYSVANMTVLLLVNHLVNWFAAARIGAWIGRIGEKRALTIEYIGLTAIFTCYAFVETAWVAGLLYVLDHLFFAMAIAIKTYFQKIADPADIASTAGVSFTINHIAAVIVPALLGSLWLESHSAVFLVGAAFAVCSLILSQNVPHKPEPGNEVQYEPSFLRVRTS